MKEKTKRNSNQIKNKSTSEGLLISYRGALMKIEEFFNAVQEKEFTIDNIDESIKLIQAVLMASERLGKAIETLSLLEKKVQTDEGVSGKARGNNKVALFEDGIE